MRIIENGLVFGDYDDANCFHIEKTDIYNRLSGKGVNSVEFILYRPEDRQLLFIEGKNTLASRTNRVSLNENISKIASKFMDSLQLTCGIWFGEYNRQVEVPKNGINFLQYGVRIIFVLVIKNRKGDLQYIADMIRTQLKKEYRLWKFKILVMNEHNAKKMKLIVSEE